MRRFIEAVKCKQNMHCIELEKKNLEKLLNKCWISRFNVITRRCKSIFCISTNLSGVLFARIRLRHTKRKKKKDSSSWCCIFLQGHRFYYQPKVKYASTVFFSLAHVLFLFFFFCKLVCLKSKLFILSCFMVVINTCPKNSTQPDDEY